MSTSPEVASSAATSTHGRSTEQVLDSHLGSFANGLDAILADYDDTSVLITPDRIFRGLGDIREFFDGFLKGATPEFWAAFTLDAKVVVGDVAYITWSSEPAIVLATDTLLVRDGVISIQTFTSFAG